MPFTPQLIPQPFGPVKVTTPGTPVRLNSGLVAQSLALTTDDIAFNKVSFIVLPANSAGGNVYIGVKGMNKSTLAGVIVILSLSAAGGTYTNWQITNNVSLNIYHLQDFWMDADNAADGIYGAFDQV